MEQEMFFDLMLDAINEADGMPVKEIVTDFETKTFVVRLEDGSVFEVKCDESEHQIGVKKDVVRRTIVW